MQLSLLISTTSSLFSSSDHDLPIVTLKTDKGNILVELYPDVAPETVANFIKLIEAEFYDGLSFHRFVKGFVIQGGDPDGNGTGGPGWTIYGEFQDSELREKMPNHQKGVIAMARKPTPNSAGSQFYICLSEDESIYKHLNGNYTTFGRVIEGIDVVDALRERDVIREVTLQPIS